MSEEAGDLGFGVHLGSDVLGVTVRSPPRLWLPNSRLRFSLLIACHEVGPGEPREGSPPPQAGLGRPEASCAGGSA